MAISFFQILRSLESSLLPVSLSTLIQSVRKSCWFYIQVYPESNHFSPLPLLQAYFCEEQVHLFLAFQKYPSASTSAPYSVILLEFKSDTLQQGENGSPFSQNKSQSLYMTTKTLHNLASSPPWSPHFSHLSLFAICLYSSCSFCLECLSPDFHLTSPFISSKSLHKPHRFHMIHPDHFILELPSPHRLLISLTLPFFPQHFSLNILYN